MRRAGYEDQESDWIDALCCAMNRWAMASAKVAAEARLWATPSSEVMGTAALASAAEQSYQKADLDIPSAVLQRQHSIPTVRDRNRYVSGQNRL